MPSFNYIALKDNKEIVKGKLDAPSLKEARALVQQMGLIPTKIFTDGDKDKNTQGSSKVRLKKLSMRELMDFTSTLKILVTTGVPIIEALIFLESNCTSKKTKAVAHELRRQIISGGTFSDTVAKYKHIFDQVYAGLTKAGEESGELDVTLDRMSVLLDKQDKLKAKVTGTLMYPAFVIVLAILVILVMLTFVFPEFKSMYEGMGAELPWITTACINTGIFLKSYWFTIPIGLGSLAYGLYFIFTWEPTRRKIDETMLKVPVAKDFITYSALSNFIAVMRVAYEAGVPIVDCLYLSNLTVHNYPLHDAVMAAAQKVQQGTHLSAALKSTEIMPPILLFMVSTGEESGKLGEMLKQTSDYIDIELERIIDTLTKMIEPIMLVVIGSIVLVLALALYLPLFQAYGHMGG